MQIRTKQGFVKKKIKDLEYPACYMIFNKASDNIDLLLIANREEHPVILTRFSNEDSVRVSGINKDNDVLIIGKVNNLDIINVDLNDMD